MSGIQLAWELHKEGVENELKRILQVDALDPTRQEYFQQRNAAASRFIASLDEPGQQEFQKQLIKRKNEGNPENVRRV